MNDPGFDSLPLCAPVLEPDLDLDLGQSEVVRDLEKNKPGLEPETLQLTVWSFST